jgi:tRNA threonylcarbamoyladenosine biosynthesis protein TsaB
MTPEPWLAIDTSGDQASVAVGSAGVILAQEVVSGTRRHAIELVPATERVLNAASAPLSQVQGILVTDGPGSFTGLRIGATVAKGLAYAGTIPVRTASALLVMARGGWRSISDPTARRVLAVTDALRGECYAALYDITESGISVLREPAVLRPEALAEWPAPDLLVSELELPGLSGQRITGEAAQPRAAVLLDLLGVTGATREIGDLVTWEPEYGRPAEAQVRWEALHGRRLPDSAGTAR